MLAIRVHRFGTPDVMRLEETDTPAPGPGQILVRLHAAGVNPVDTYIRSGQYGRLPELPYTPGYDGAGEVVQVSPAGVAAPAWPKPGDRVWVGKRARDGTYAQYALCTPDQVHPLPERLSYAQGAGIYVGACTAWRALFGRAHAAAGETVLIHGASGGVGLAAVQLARAAGLRVAGTAGTAHGLDLIRAQGADAAFDHRAPGYESQIRDWAASPSPRGPGGGGGVDVIVEMLANVNLARDLDLLAPRGRVVVVGNRGAIEFNPRSVMSKEASVLGMSLMNLTATESAQTAAGVQAALEAGTLTPVVARVVPLADAARAHELVLSPGASGKVVLTIPHPA